jgi:hypothetical protein
MHDPFEQSLRELLNEPAEGRDDRAALGRVLKTANRQVGVGELFSLTGHWFETVLMALNTKARRPKRDRLGASADVKDEAE